MALKQANGGPLIAYAFVPFGPIVESALESHLESEAGKANRAYEKFGNQIAVTFNDLAVAALAKNGAFSPAARSATEGALPTLFNESAEASKDVDQSIELAEAVKLAKHYIDRAIDLYGTTQQTADFLKRFLNSPRPKFPEEIALLKQAIDSLEIELEARERHTTTSQ